MYRWQKRQKLTIPYLVMPTVMSALARAQASQMLPMEGRNCTPHIGQRIVTSLLGSTYIVDYIITQRIYSITLALGLIYN